MADHETDAGVGDPTGEPRPAAISFITTEHFTLQGARAATISESTGRASMFFGSVSAGLVALGLIAAAQPTGTVFDVVGLVLLFTLTFVGVVTFERALQCGIEDLGYAQRIARLRAYYFEQAPELTPYIHSVPTAERLQIQGLWNSKLQGFRTIAGMISVVTSVLAGSATALLITTASGHSLGAAIPVGAAVAILGEAGLMRYQRVAWMRTH